MKKNVLLLVLLSFFVGVGSTFAQGVSGGIKAGLNLANQNSSSTSTTSLVGYHGGFYLTLMFSEHLGLQPEILYSAQGSKSTVFSTTVSQKFDYVTIPVLIRYNLNQLLSFHAGPQLGLLTAAKYVNGSNSIDIKDNIKSTDVGVAAGATVDLPFGLNFTLRYILGLSDINDSGSSTTIKNNNLQVSVGYRLFGKN